MGEQCDQTHMSVGSSQVPSWGQKRKRGWEEMKPEKTERCSWKWKHQANWKGSVMKKGFFPSYNKTVSDFILGALKSLQMVTAAMKLKDASFLDGSYDQPR